MVNALEVLQRLRSVRRVLPAATVASTSEPVPLQVRSGRFQIGVRSRRATCAVCGPPKTASGERVVDRDDVTVGVLTHPARLNQG